MVSLNFLILFLEIIDKGGNTFESFLAALLDLDDKFYVGLDGSAQVLYLLEHDAETYTLSAQYGLGLAHLLHSVVHHTLKIVDLYD